jgi:non-ribosomal peptide synthetase component F
MEYLWSYGNNGLRCTLLTHNDNPITIGKPIANTQIYLLDSDRNLVSNGEVGEM